MKALFILVILAKIPLLGSKSTSNLFSTFSSQYPTFPRSHHLNNLECLCIQQCFLGEANFVHMYYYIYTCIHIVCVHTCICTRITHICIYVCVCSYVYLKKLRAYRADFPFACLYWFSL